ncbi:MAG TPA: glucose 1-dehydrogenase [Anaerolineaceae bacterium]
MDTNTLYQSITPRYPELREKVAIVTGSSRGIGKGIAIRLAKEGMRVVITSNIAGDVEQTARELSACGAQVLPVVADLSQSEPMERLVTQTINVYGRIDLLVNNAADLRRKKFLEGAESLLDYQLAVNIRAPFLLALRAAEWMKRNGGGSIIHISSVGGLRAHHNSSPYDMTKGALDALTRGMAVDLGPEGIRVNAVAPGSTLSRSLVQDLELAKRIPLQRSGTILEMAAAVAFLASEEASYITGQVLYVDGGITAQLAPITAQV